MTVIADKVELDYLRASRQVALDDLVRETNSARSALVSQVAMLHILKRVAKDRGHEWNCKEQEEKVAVLREKHTKLKHRLFLFKLKYGIKQ